MTTLPKGFQLVQTGGGCTAWQRTDADGSYICVTDADGASADWSVNDVLICSYDTEGRHARDLNLIDFLAAHGFPVVQQ